jgi:FlaA1/EpsC-like NDP-sugar epimerase
MTSNPYADKNVLVTDERMTRCILTPNDAIDLVLYAIEYTRGGEFAKF